MSVLDTLNDAVSDATSLSDIVNGAPDATVTTRLGRTVKTIAHVVGDVLLGASIYANTTTALAAVAEGAYFAVPSGDADEYTILYRKTGGVAVEVKRYPSLGWLDSIAAAASASASSAAGSASAAASSQSAASTSESNAAGSADSADASAIAAQTAAEASGNVSFYDTYAAANAAIGGLPDLRVVEVFADETLGNRRTMYRLETGVLVFKLALSLMQDEGSAAPIAGTWPTGWRRWSTAPGGTGLVIGWVCTAGGTPGTWEPIYGNTIGLLPA